MVEKNKIRFKKQQFAKTCENRHWKSLSKKAWRNSQYAGFRSRWVISSMTTYKDFEGPQKILKPRLTLSKF